MKQKRGSAIRLPIISELPLLAEPVLLAHQPAAAAAPAAATGVHVRCAAAANLRVRAGLRGELEWHDVLHVKYM